MHVSYLRVDFGGFMWYRVHDTSVMSEAHPTTTPEQLETDAFAVFREVPGESDLKLIERPDVPSYDGSNEDGEQLSQSTRMQLAVMHAVEADGTSIYPEGTKTLSMTRDVPVSDGEEFMVMHDVEESMTFTPYRDDEALRETWENHGEEL